MPIHSVKFLDDVCQAAGWLEKRGKGQQPLIDYITALNYRSADFPNGKPLPPLKGLGLPDDPTLDFFVDDVSQKCLKSALIWVLGHEMGHVYHQHPGYNTGLTRKQIRGNETQADDYANLVFRRIGVPPSGMAQFFVVASIIWTPPNALATKEKWTQYLQRTRHPIGSKRLNRIAEVMKHKPKEFAFSEPDRELGLRWVQQIADNMEIIAERLSDPKLQSYMISRSKILDLKAMTLGNYTSPEKNPFP